MEFLQYCEGEQLAWERCTDDLLDGQTLDVAHCYWVRYCGCGRSVSLVLLEYVDYEGKEKQSRTETNGSLEKNKWWERKI